MHIRPGQIIRFYLLNDIIDTITVTESDSVWVKGYTTLNQNGNNIKYNIVINLKNVIKYDWIDYKNSDIKKSFEITSGIKSDPDPNLKSLDMVENAKTLAELRVEQQRSKQKEIKDFLSSKEINSSKETYGMPIFKKRS